MRSIRMKDALYNVNDQGAKGRGGSHALVAQKFVSRHLGDADSSLTPDPSSWASPESSFST